MGRPRERCRTLQMTSAALSMPLWQNCPSPGNPYALPTSSRGTYRGWNDWNMLVRSRYKKVERCQICGSCVNRSPYTPCAGLLPAVCWRRS
jgi:hypothetical protein